MSTLKIFQIFQGAMIIVMITGVSVVLYFDSALPKTATQERTQLIANKKGPPVFGTEKEYSMYQIAHNLSVGAIFAGAISVAIAIRLRSGNAKHA